MRRNIVVDDYWVLIPFARTGVRSHATDASHASESRRFRYGAACLQESTLFTVLLLGVTMFVLRVNMGAAIVVVSQVGSLLAFAVGLF